jgi:hypothetical protein
MGPVGSADNGIGRYFVHPNNSTANTTRHFGAPNCGLIPRPTPSFTRACRPLLPVPSNRVESSHSLSVSPACINDRKAEAP